MQLTLRALRAAEGSALTTLGKRVRALRLSRGDSLRDLAADTGSSKDYLSNLERGKARAPSLLLVARIAARYGTSLDYLWGGRTDEEASMRNKEALKRAVSQAVDNLLP